LPGQEDLERNCYSQNNLLDKQDFDGLLLLTYFKRIFKWYKEVVNNYFYKF